MPPLPSSDVRETNDRCPFCQPADGAVWLKADGGLALWDAYPVSEGHALVVPSRHVTSIYDLTPVEQSRLWQLVAAVRERLIEPFAPDGFNIGINDGVAAGQTVGHAHIHVIPRRRGDVVDPRGGIRWVIPAKAPYWETR
jgi:diadenosine tetraphosphate (Ap4A) HIT family hydrolase